MTETSLAKQNPTALALTEWSVMKEQATMLVKTGFLPESIKTPEQAMAIMLTGRELGIPPMTALRKIAVIKGNPTVSPELMLAMCKKHYAVLGKVFQYAVVSEDEKGCAFWAKTPETEYTGTFSETDAKSAGLIGKQNWTSYKAAMYRARAISLTLRVVCPDVILGLYTPDEMGAVVGVEGEVIQLEEAPEPTQSRQSRKAEPESEPRNVDWDEGADPAIPANIPPDKDMLTELKHLSTAVLGDDEDGANVFKAMLCDEVGHQHAKASELTRVQFSSLIDKLNALRDTMPQ